MKPKTLTIQLNDEQLPILPVEPEAHLSFTTHAYDGIVGTSIARLTRRYDDFPRYEVSTLLERERSIQEISGQIQDYALPFFARFSDLSKLLDDVEREGFFPHRKGFDVPKRNREFIECFRKYLQKQ